MRRAMIVLAVLVALTVPAEAARAEDSLAITSPAAGTTIAGSVLIAATAPAAATVITFDRSLDGGATWTPIGSDGDGSNGWRATWNTAPLDGPAIIRASDGEQVATQAVTLLNVPRVSLSRSRVWFSPNRDGVRDTTTLSARINEPGRISLAAIDASGNVRRRWVRDFAAPGTYTVTWTGRTASGTRLPNGRYTIRATATDIAGNRSSVSKTVVIDTVKPRIVFTGVSPEPSDGSGTHRFKFEVRDRDRLFNGRMAVRDNVRLLKSRALSLSSRDATVSWTPSSKLYPGTYRTKVRMTDRAGNKGAYSVRAWRVHRSMTGRVKARFTDVGRRVAITFDDCHYGDAWRSILDTLKARNIRASFFCPSTMIEARPRLARRTVKARHSIGSHGGDHAYLAGRSDWFIRSRLLDDRRAWWRYGGATAAPYFRPPYGAYDSRVLRIAGETSMPRVMMWSVDPRDWTRPGASVIANRVLSNARPGSVILLHTLPQTAKALPAILDGLRKRELRPVSLDKMYAS